MYQIEEMVEAGELTDSWQLVMSDGSIEPAFLTLSQVETGIQDGRYEVVRILQDTSKS